MELLDIGGRTGPAFVARVIGHFLADAPEILERLAHALAREDRSGVERALHTLRSSAAYVGAMALSNLAAILENHARSGELEAVRRRVDETDLELAHADRQLAALRAAMLHSEEEPVDP
jgi:HPt (histidine-containing phosphotransfer) domain-containing protein